MNKVLYAKLEVIQSLEDTANGNNETHTFYGNNAEEKANIRAKELRLRYPDKPIYIGVFKRYGD